VGYILDNPIYYGELLWEEHATGIVNDTRVLERNAEEDMLRVPDYCEPIVARELWQEVQELRQKRSRQIIDRRSAAKDNGKQIEPLAPGLTLKYLLSGLARCGHCSASLRPSPSKAIAKSGKVWRRVYYACPKAMEGNCPNSRYVPEDWLREVAIARLRSRLFPSPDQAGELPEWFGPLAEEVRQELKRLEKETPDQRPVWEHEKKGLEDQVAGWSLSLANPRLDPILRTDIEAQYGQAKSRILQLDGLLAEHCELQSRLDKVLEPQQVLDGLQRLADVLSVGNPTRGNLELSLHVDRIDCFADGTVVMRTNKLGMFEGATELLRQPQKPNGANGHNGQAAQVHPRRRARHRIEEDQTKSNGQCSGTVQPSDPRRFAGLDDRWFWSDSFEIPQSQSWAAANAAKVAELRIAGWTVERLASHFGKTPPTIRHALRLAAEAMPVLQELPRKMPRPCWAKVNAAEVAAMKDKGMSTAQLANHFGMSDTTIRAALKHAEAFPADGEPATDAAHDSQGLDKKPHEKESGGDRDV
jgi:lambda repressor-like predicted transcriptional regulator